MAVVDGALAVEAGVRLICVLCYPRCPLAVQSFLEHRNLYF
jgi:hypothetical protein